MIGSIIIYKNTHKASIIFTAIFTIIAISFVLFQLKYDVLANFARTQVQIYLLTQWLLVILIFSIKLSLFAIAIILGSLFLLYMLTIQLFSETYEKELLLQSAQNEIEQFDHTLLSVRAQRHDFLKHANTLHYLINEKNYQAAKQYMSDLVADYHVINEAIKGELSHIASVLLQYAKQAEEENILMTYRLSVPASNLPLQPTDQVNLLANLLANAVEAASDAPTKMREIVVATSVYGGIYRLEITNSTALIPDHIIDHLFKKYNLTTKNGDHEGLGTYIIKEIVTRYEGQIDYTYEANQMKITVTFPNVKNVS